MQVGEINTVLVTVHTVRLRAYSVSPEYGDLIFRPQTLLRLSGTTTRHAPDTIKYDSDSRLPSGRVYSHLRGSIHGNFLFGPFWSILARYSLCLRYFKRVRTSTEHYGQI